MEVELISERIAEAIIEERFINKASLVSRIAPIIKIWSSAPKNIDTPEKHKEEGDFIERTVLKLQRQYSKDELVAYLNKSIAEKDFRIGELTSEIDELKNDILKLKEDHQRNVNIESNKALRIDKVNLSRIEKIKKLEKMIDRYKKANNELLSKLNDTK